MLNQSYTDGALVFEAVDGAVVTGAGVGVAVAGSVGGGGGTGETGAVEDELDDDNDAIKAGGGNESL